MIAFQLITAALRDALAAAAVADVVMKGRLRPIAASESTAIVVRYDRSSGQAGGIQDGPVDWDTAVAIDCYVRVDDGTDPEDAAGVLLGQAWGAINGLQLDGLGVSSVLANPEVVAAPSDVDPGLTCLTLFLTVQHRTFGANLTPWI